MVRSGRLLVPRRSWPAAAPHDRRQCSLALPPRNACQQQVRLTLPFTALPGMAVDPSITHGRMHLYHRARDRVAQQRVEIQSPANPDCCRQL